MSLTQKRFFQVPLLLLLIFVGVIPIEWTLLAKLPFHLGPIQLLPIVMTYIALTRNFTTTVAWGLFLGSLTTFSLPFAYGDAIAAQTWATVAAKLMTYVLPFESPLLFAGLVCFQSLFFKILWRIFTYAEFKGIPWSWYAFDNFPPFFTLFIVSLFLFPYLIFWDEFFENSRVVSRDLSPRISGMKR